MPTRAILTILATVTAAIGTAQVQPPRQPGLLVRLYDIEGSMHFLPELAPSQLPNLVKVVPTLDLQTKRGDFGEFRDSFFTEVLGYLSISQPGAYAFRLISDDGAKLWIDGRLVIDHDGLHGAEPKDGEIVLAAGQHTLRVVHFESAGDEHLSLQWRRAGAERAEFALIPPAALAHDKRVSRETSPGKKKIIPPLRRGRPGDGSPVMGMHPAFRDSPPQQKTHLELSSLSHGFLMVYASRAGQPVPTVWVPDSTPTDDSQAIARLPGGSYPRQKSVRLPGESKRVFLDEENGCAFRFAGRRFDRLDTTEEVPFEPLAVRAMTNGFEIEFTKPLDPRCGWEPDSYYIEQWPFVIDWLDVLRLEGTKRSEREAQARARPPQRDGIRYPVKSASVSEDRKQVFLEIENLKPWHVVYIRLLPPCISEDGELPWSTEAWYTLNTIPENRMGEVRTPPPAEPHNFLTEDEKAAGWELLFDGKTTNGWRGYKKETFPHEGWKAIDGCLVRVGPGGDIITEGQFDNFELKLEWRICAGGNSGIFYRVSEQYGWPWESGPELQVLDNAEHADGRNPLTAAGSNYGLHAPVRDVTEPVGFFNQVRIVADGPHIEHWLNGVKIVEYELGSPEWEQLVAKSKFGKLPNYGRMKQGHIVLQDHGDTVWYRNVKIRELGRE